MHSSLLWLALAIVPLQANGIARWGFGAADAATAGSFSATGGDALATLQGNPAAMSLLGSGGWTLSAQAIAGDADYSRSGEDYDLQNALGVIPEAALVWQIPERPLWLGASLSVPSALKADWDYPDAPGGIGGISYADAGHESSFLVAKANLALAWKPSETWSFGASLGLLYSRVDFDAPFIFQTNPALAGAKVDLDLETSGWAPAFDAGALWAPAEPWKIGLRVRAASTLENDGTARADYSAQLPPLGLGGTDSRARYDASTENTLPLTIALGTSWQSTGKLRLGATLEWFHWSDSFDAFPVRLSHGSNAALNSAIGSSPSDAVPLRWDDRLAIALGAEYAVHPGLTLRAGWRYAESPVPGDLVTPLNGSILEHSFSLGAGWKMGDWRIDAAYTLGLGEQAVGTSGYRAGEYSDSRLEVAVHGLGISASKGF
ncbi:MAG: OmpP1/FadL family transporter [Luteolibacter sp.]